MTEQEIINSLNHIRIFNFEDQDYDPEDEEEAQVQAIYPEGWCDKNTWDEFLIKSDKIYTHNNYWMPFKDCVEEILGYCLDADDISVEVLKSLIARRKETDGDIEWID